MMKRCAVVLCLFCVLSLFGFASAEPDTIRRYSHISSIYANLRIEDGTAYSDGDITPNDFTANYTARITVYLQRKANGSWQTVASWSDSQVNGTAIAGGSRTVTPGYEYRTYVVGTISAADGTLLERATRTSG